MPRARQQIKRQAKRSQRKSSQTSQYPRGAYLFYLLLLAILIAITAFALSAEFGTGKATQLAPLNSKNLPSNLRITDMLVLPEGHLPGESVCWRPVDAPVAADDGYAYQSWARLAGCEQDQ